MALIPPFHLGWLNLWICTALLYARPIVIARLTGTDWERARDQPEMSQRERVIYTLWIGAQTALCVYAFFVPLALTSVWFPAGLILFAAGLAFSSLAIYTYQTAPRDAPITLGLYRLSRNPGYFGAFLMYAGMGLMGAAWPILALALVHFALYQITATYEERMCAERWPEMYVDYRQRTAKNFWFF
jgi:protein-S-isoprenylcysteine O-methyltransferase Ste14